MKNSRFILLVTALALATPHQLTSAAPISLANDAPPQEENFGMFLLMNWQLDIIQPRIEKLVNRLMWPKIVKSNTPEHHLYHSHDLASGSLFKKMVGGGTSVHDHHGFTHEIPHGIDSRITSKVEIPDNDVTHTLSNVKFDTNIYDWKESTGLNELNTTQGSTSIVDYVREPGTEGLEATMPISLNLDDITLSTMDIPGSDAVVSMLIDITSPELGTIFRDSTSIRQGESVIGGGSVLPWQVTSPGNLFLDGHLDSIDVAIPGDLDAWTVSKTIEFRVNSMVPEPSTFLGLFLGMMALLSFSRSRRQAV